MCLFCEERLDLMDCAIVSVCHSTVRLPLSAVVWVVLSLFSRFSNFVTFRRESRESLISVVIQGGVSNLEHVSFHR